MQVGAEGQLVGKRMQVGVIVHVQRLQGLQRTDLLHNRVKLGYKRQIVLTWFKCRKETPGPPTNPSPTTEQGLIGLQKTNRIKLFLNTHRDAP